LVRSNAPQPDQPGRCMNRTMGGNQLVQGINRMQRLTSIGSNVRHCAR
jgi:hypothetical protein